MKHILTPDEFIIRAVNAYPSLYASPSPEETKFRILDQTLNTIGNGIYMESFEGEPVSDAEIAEAQKWFHCERAAYGYMKTCKLGEGKHSWEMPEGDPELVVRSEEMKDHPEIVYWVEFNTNELQDPYPNFQKEYSPVWDKSDISFEALGVEWAQAAHWFYCRCRDYFLDAERVRSYHRAFPLQTKQETENAVTDCMKYFDTNEYPSNADISKAWGCEFIGERTNREDVVAFLTRRWDMEHRRILSFIEESLVHLSSMASQA